MSEIESEMTTGDPSLIRTGRSLHAAGAAVMVLLAIGPYVVAGLPMSSQNSSLQRQIDKTTRLLEYEPDVRARNEKLRRELEAHEERRREVLERIPEAADEETGRSRRCGYVGRGGAGIRTSSAAAATAPMTPASAKNIAA